MRIIDANTTKFSIHFNNKKYVELSKYEHLEK